MIFNPSNNKKVLICKTHHQIMIEERRIWEGVKKLGPEQHFLLGGKKGCAVKFQSQ